MFSINQNSVPMPDQKPGVLGPMAHNYNSILSGEGLTEVSTGESLNEIIFENRNKAYGAYVLRKDYAENVLKGVFVTLTVVVLAITLPAIMEALSGGKEIHTTPPKKLVYTELTAPPPIDKPKPPPPQIQLPKLQKVIKFVPPKVVKEQITEEVPTIEEIKQNETAAEEVEGTEVVFTEPVEEVVVDNSDEIFTVVEQNPEFEGGYAAMVNFIKANMKYPLAARRMGIEGTVHVSLLVNKQGEIDEVKVLRGIHPDCDKEAVRVVQLMPHWKPGKQNGRPVHVRFVLPLKFRMN